jgi:hypothetical protein
MKKSSQDRDRAALTDGTAKSEDMLLLKPDQMKDARVKWPTGSLKDDC